MDTEKYYINAKEIQKMNPTEVVHILNMSFEQGKLHERNKMKEEVATLLLKWLLNRMEKE